MKKYQENFHVICSFFAYLNYFPKKNKNIQNKYKSHAKFLFVFIWKKIWPVYRPRFHSLYTGFCGSGITYLNYSQVVISAENLIFKHELIFPTFETIFFPGTPPPRVSLRQNMSSCFFFQNPKLRYKYNTSPK